MRDVPPITSALLRQLLNYDAKTGDFSWAAPTREWFASDAHWAAFNSIKQNKNPFADAHNQGYLLGTIGTVQLLAHRAVWAYCHGDWPRENIDHINHDRTDNRIANLRSVSQSENARNANRRSDNNSGYTGVCWSKSRKKWVAQIGLPGNITKPLGRYSLLEDAVAARMAAEILYGFHPNHGKNTADLSEQVK